MSRSLYCKPFGAANDMDVGRLAVYEDRERIRINKVENINVHAYKSMLGTTDYYFQYAYITRATSNIYKIPVTIGALPNEELNN